jgi:hypothetical protein
MHAMIGLIEKKYMKTNRIIMNIHKQKNKRIGMLCGLPEPEKAPKKTRGIEKTKKMP